MATRTNTTFMRNSVKRIHPDTYRITCTNSDLTFDVNTATLEALIENKLCWEEYPKNSKHIVARPSINGKQMHIKLEDFIKYFVDQEKEVKARKKKREEIKTETKTESTAVKETNPVRVEEVKMSDYHIRVDYRKAPGISRIYLFKATQKDLADKNKAKYMMPLTETQLKEYRNDCGKEADGYWMNKINAKMSTFNKYTKLIEQYNKG